jgi:predicted PurR-regulated permease PerM
MALKKMSSCIFTLILIAMFVIIPMSWAESSSDKSSLEDIRQETQDLIEALKTYSIDQRDEVVRKAKATLDNLDNRIDTLETRVDNNWDKMDKAAREKARAALRALRKQRNRVAEGYGSLKSSSADAWEHMKKGFSDAYQKLYDAWEKTEKEFESKK